MNARVGRFGDAPLTELLAGLDRLRVRLEVQDGRLRCVAPPGVLTPDLVAVLRLRRAEVLRHLGDRPNEAVMTPTSDAPLSFPQQRLWLHHYRDANDTAYHLPLAVTLSGSLRPAALRQALAEIVRRHEVLRTSCPMPHDAPVQRVAAYRPPPMPLIDLTGLPQRARLAALTALATAHARRPFDLATDPPHRTALVRLVPTEHRLLLTRHHIASDGWSFGLLAAELTTLYAAMVDGAAARLPRLPWQYADFARWQRQAANDDSARAKAERWRRRLDGARYGVGIVGESASRDAAEPVHVVHGLLTAELGGAIGSAAREAGTTPFTVFVTAFGLVLAAAAHQLELVLGTPVSGRSHPRTRRLIGCFATMVPLRLCFDGNPTFRTALDRTHEVVTEALCNQDVPLEQILDAACLGHRGVSAFPVVFALQNTPAARLELPGLTAVAADPVPVAPKYPLTVTATAAGGEYRLLAEFDPAAIHETTVAQLIDRFSAMLAGACRQPQLTCAQLLRQTAPPADPAATTRRSAAYGRVSDVDTLATRFTRVAQRTPDAIAVSCDEVHVSYGALLDRARRLAGELRARGVRPETHVVVCVGHSVDLLVAIVGSTLSGGAYVPVDPDDPPVRHESVILDANAAAVVTESRLAHAFAWYDGPVICADDLPYGTTRQPRPPSAASPDNLAYVVYTSGTTGTSKGVMVSHRSVLAMFAGADRPLRFSPDDVWTLTHPIAFDFSVWEMWGALLHGARLAVVPRRRVRETDELRDLLLRERATVLSATPSAFLMFARTGVLRPTDAAAGAIALRAVVLGGERCEPAALRDWFDAGGPADDRPALINMYGITETTVHTTHRRLTAADTTSQVSPIGVPLPGVHVHVVDPAGAPAPSGGQGEILVGGGGLARGYLGRPGLTADRFRPDGLGGADGSRLYTSGDLAIRLPGGELGYVGRLDHQLKVRGYRIEPAEVEAVLLGHPGVAATAVVARAADQRTALVAYVVPSGPTAPTARELRRYLAQRLPGYMVPAAYPVLDRLPVNRNGKLDRDALPAVGTAAGTATPPEDRPRTETERRLARLWCELLGTEAVGIHDDFFDLGGDSLLVSRLHARLPEAFGVELPMRRLYEVLDVAALADLIDGLTVDGDRSGGRR